MYIKYIFHKNQKYAPKWGFIFNKLLIIYLVTYLLFTQDSEFNLKLLQLVLQTHREAGVKCR